MEAPTKRQQVGGSETEADVPDKENRSRPSQYMLQTTKEATERSSHEA